jgi:TonB family protein
MNSAFTSTDPRRVMRRGKPWWMAALLAMGTTAVTGADQPTSVTRTPPIQREAGDVRWSEWVVSSTFDTCDPRPLRTEPPREDQLRFNCVSHLMEVRNDSARPVQCSMLLELTEPDFRTARRIGQNEIIYPGRVGRTYESLAPATALPASFSSTCEPVPLEPPVLPEASPECSVRFEGKHLDAYYPDSAIRRKQEGTIQIDFVLNANGRLARQPTWASTSGIESLDRAARHVLMAARTVSNCPEQILRAEVQFKLEEESGQVTLRWIPGNGTAAR